MPFPFLFSKLANSMYQFSCPSPKQATPSLPDVKVCASLNVSRKVQPSGLSVRHAGALPRAVEPGPASDSTREPYHAGAVIQSSPKVKLPRKNALAIPAVFTRRVAFFATLAFHATFFAPRTLLIGVVAVAKTSKHATGTLFLGVRCCHFSRSTGAVETFRANACPR